MPIVKARKQLQQLNVGKTLKEVATDPGSVLDFQGWAKTARTIELVNQDQVSDEAGKEFYVHYVRRLA